jgi:hypothetical protein
VRWKCSAPFPVRFFLSLNLEKEPYHICPKMTRTDLFYATSALPALRCNSMERGETIWTLAVVATQSVDYRAYALSERLYGCFNSATFCAALLLSAVIGNF